MDIYRLYFKNGRRHSFVSQRTINWTKQLLLFYMIGMAGSVYFKVTTFSMPSDAHIKVREVQYFCTEITARAVLNLCEVNLDINQPGYVETGTLNTKLIEENLKFDRSRAVNPRRSINEKLLTWKLFSDHCTSGKLLGTCQPSKWFREDKERSVFFKCA